MGDGAGAELRSAVSALHEKLEKQYRPAGSYPHVESLTEENEDLKRTLVGLIQAVQGHRSALSAATHEEADRMIRAQLRSQLDREHQWIAPILGKRPY
jgi:peptidoglycan/xylan/chitin deacetylase (PgdA/CDA1 family)